MFVTGIGCVSALGLDLASTEHLLREGKDCARDVTLFSTAGCTSHRAGELPVEATAEFQKTPLTSVKNPHRVSEMLWHCWKQASRERPDFIPQAAVFGTTSGGMSYGEDFFRNALSEKTSTNFRDQVREYMPQQAALDLIAEMQWDMAPLIISNACASGSNAVGHAWHLIAHGLADRVICGGYDALSQLVFAGFDSLKALSATRCSPFDRDRAGLLLGEGAAVLLLESESSAKRAGISSSITIAGYGVAMDNHHLTQPNPNGWGPRTAMEDALRSAGRSTAEIDYINAHGTATPFNDLSEGRAILDLFPQVPVSSTKALTGHALGAAGAIEAVFCVLALRGGFLPVQANWTTPDPEIPIHLVQAGKNYPAPHRVLSNSFGFGGSNASILLEKKQDGL